MDSKVLRIACEELDADFISYNEGEYFASFSINGLTYEYMMEEPVLPAYVASLLVAKVRERRKCITLDALLMDATPGDEGIGTATDEQRIHAALDVLRDGWREE